MKALIALALLGIITLFAEIFKFKKFLFPIVLIGLLGTTGALITEWGFGNTYYNMVKMDSFAILFGSLILLTGFLWFIFSQNAYKDSQNITDYYGLILFSMVGALALVSYNNMVMLFLGVEILSIPVYILAGSNKTNLESNESSLKYFLMGAFATGFLLFGIALIYGISGSFYLDDIRNSISNTTDVSSGMLKAAIVFLLVGLGFKVAAAPLHFWTPDVYKGAPTVVTAYMATIVKAGAFAAFLRLFLYCFGDVRAEWSALIWGLSILSIGIGNITAVFQSSAKRMLAYSSISHAGFMLIAILTLNEFSVKSLLYYTAAYAVASIGAFAVLEKVAIKNGSDEISSFKGLAKKNPLLATTMTISLLSMAGIPPLAGFFGKYFIFTAAFSSGYIGLVILAIIGSLIGVYYYFKIIIAMFTGDSQETIQLPLNTKLILFLTAFISVVLGLFPDIILNVFG